MSLDNDQTDFAAGFGSATATAAALQAVTATLAAPTANLGGYATAQIIAGALGLPAGPALSVGIAAIGGPIAAAALAAVGVGAVAVVAVRIARRVGAMGVR